MKKLLSILLAAALVLSLGLTAAFAEGETADKGTLTDGDYSFTTTGYVGEIEITVSIRDNAISAITVGENNETIGLGSKALEMLPEEIIAAQSTGIDGVTSATLTSRAIFSAVDQAIEAAGGNLAAWKEYAYEDFSEAEPIALSADVVVVGGGGSGLAGRKRRNRGAPGEDLHPRRQHRHVRGQLRDHRLSVRGQGGGGKCEGGQHRL